MCKRVDLLIDEFENGIGRNKENINRICYELNQCKLDDKDIVRIASILIQNKEWYWLFSLLMIVIMFFVVVSLFLSVVFTSIYSILLLIFPPSFAISLTLFGLMTLISRLQCT